MDVGGGLGGQEEFGPGPGWRRPGGTNRMFFSFVWRTWGEGDRGAPVCLFVVGDGVWFKAEKRSLLPARATASYCNGTSGRI